jgi:hypothetical protein
MLERVRHVLGLPLAQKNSPFWMAGVVAVLLLGLLVAHTTVAVSSRARSGHEVSGGEDQPHESVELEGVSGELPVRGEVEAEQDGSWGESVDGVAIKVRAERQSWYEGETPKFRVDVRSNGTVECKLGLTQEGWEVELDGVWYGAGAIFSGDFRTLTLGAGQQHRDIEFCPEERSEWNIHGQRLEFTPGWHTVRLARYASTRGAYHALHLVSNPVVIEVLPAEWDKREWGEAVGGLQCGLRADKVVWEVDETPKLGAVARNVGGPPRHFRRSSELFYVKAAGKIWYWKGAASDEPVELNPGEAFEERTIVLTEDWAGLGDDRLELSPGRHIVQLVMFLTEPREGAGTPAKRIFPRQLRIESNVVVIEVLADGGEAETVADEDDASKTLQAELYEVWRRRDGDFAGAEALGKKLLEKYEKPEEQSLIYYQLAEIYAQSGQVDPSKMIEYARNGWWHLNDPVKKAQLFVYWGYALELSGRRREAAKIYLRGLAFCIRFGLPREKPERPGVGRHAVDSPKGAVEGHRRGSELEMAAWRHARLIEDLIEHRQALTGQIVRLYAREPDAFDELDAVVMRYLYSEEAAQQLVAAAKSYRSDSKTAIPVITRAGGGLKAKTWPWGKAVEGVQIRLREVRRRWLMEEEVKFKVDIRNEGRRDLRLASGPDFWDVEVDGVWYSVTNPLSRASDSHSRPFGPGRHDENLPLWLDKAFGWRSENGRLELTPGRHTIRAALGRGLSEDGTMSSVRPVSNAVEIEIVPPESGGGDSG